MKNLFRILPLLLLLVAGCAVTPPAVTPTGDTSVDEAMQAFYEGQYDEAIRRFTPLRDKAVPPKRQEYELYIAEALHKSERSQQALQMLESMNLAGLSPQLLVRRQLLRGDIVLRKDPELALSILQRPAAPASERTLYADFYRLRAAAYSRLEKPLDTAREFVAREPFLASEAEREANQLAIWQALGTLSREALEQTRRQPPPDTLSGWIELAAMAKNLALGPEMMQQRIDLWRRAYPGHPVKQKFLADLLERSRELTRRPSVIGLLLPLSGQFAQAGAAIRDGVLAAYYQSPGHESIRLNIYDAGTSPEQILSRYQLAVSEGAQFVIGPLDKGQVQVLATQDQLPVPVLALNYTGPAMNDNIFQFALSPEEEAIVAAERAWADGHTRMAVIASDDALGNRMAEAFAARWNELGGILAGKTLYEPQQMDYTTQLEDLLKLADSDARRQRLQQVLGKKLEFTPRRRQDIQALFVAALPIQGRLLRPQLKFNFAGDLPIYATSTIYGGRPDANQDRDLDGVMFCDMPWTFDSDGPQQAQRHALQANLPHYGGQLQRLVAMGIDAYHLVPMLRTLQSYPYERYPGETGTLRLESGGRLLRQLKWARFKDGLPQPLENLTD
ncbi:MAG TPA: penicillin-binding protein activator [Gammaproteobacteria bacterium]